jgi:hypothetical protein
MMRRLSLPAMVSWIRNSATHKPGKVRIYDQSKSISCPPSPPFPLGQYRSFSA